MSELILAHHGVKGQKWGVRRYTDRHGNLTPRGAKRYSMETMQKAGASKRIVKLEGARVYSDSKTMKRVNKAVNRLDSNNFGKRYSGRQRARDYNRAINGLNYMKAKQVTRSLSDADYVVATGRRIQRKKQVSPEKVKQYMHDNKLLKTNIDIASHEFINYKKQAQRVIDKMKNDKSVTYTTYKNTLSSNTASSPSTFYEYEGTSYNVKKNTKRRSKSKRYSDPYNKRQRSEGIVKKHYQYYYY